MLVGKVLFAQSCPTLCDHMDCGPPGFSVHGILQPRILEWAAIPFSNGSSWARDWTWVSCIASRFFTIHATRGYLCVGVVMFKNSASQSCLVAFMCPNWVTFQIARNWWSRGKSSFFSLWSLFSPIGSPCLEKQGDKIKGINSWLP